MTTKFPLLAFVAELAAQMEAGQWDLDLLWVPRDQNIEADAITNDNLEDFAPENEVRIDPAKMGFMVLEELLNLGEGFYGEREAAKAAKEGAGLARPMGEAGPKGGGGDRKAKMRRASLRETDPW